MNYRPLVRALIKNICIQALVALPLALVAFYCVQRFLGEVGPKESVLDLTLIYPALLVVTLVGVVLFTVVITAVGQSREIGRPVIVGIASLAWLPLILISLGRLLTWPAFVAGVAVGCLTLGLLATKPVPTTHARQAAA